MKVEVAKSAGFCFGVDRAVTLAEETAKRGPAATLGPIVHNAEVVAELERNGVPYRFNTYPGVGHGTGLGRGLACDGWFEDAVAFWEEQLGRSNR